MTAKVENADNGVVSKAEDEIPRVEKISVNVRKKHWH